MPLPADTTIFDVADSIGVVIDSACRSGTCGTCKVKLLSGSVTMAVKDALSAEEERSGVIFRLSGEVDRRCGDRCLTFESAMSA